MRDIIWSNWKLSCEQMKQDEGGLATSCKSRSVRMKNEDQFRQTIAGPGFEFDMS